MTRRGMGWSLVLGIAVCGGAWMATAQGQSQPARTPVKPVPKTPAKPPQAKPTPARAPTQPDRPAREITLTGRVVTVQSYMSTSGSGDATKATTDSLRSGGAAALESPMGLVILGQGNTGAMKLLLPMANQQVEAHGKLFEKGGVKFLDIDTIGVVEEDEDEPADEPEGEEGGE